MVTTTLRPSELPAARVLVLLVTLSAILLGAADAPDPVPLSDPYGLGERLVIIDDLRQRGLPVPEQADLPHLRQAWWEAHEDPADNRLIAVDSNDPASLRSECDQLRRRNDRLRQQVALLERRLQDHVELQRRYQRLRAHVLDETPLGEDELTRLTRSADTAAPPTKVDDATTADTTTVETTTTPRDPPPTPPDPPTEAPPRRPRPVPDLPPIHLDEPRPLPADFPDPPIPPAPVTTDADDPPVPTNSDDTLPGWWLLLPFGLIAIVGLGFITRRGHDLHRHTARVLAHRLPAAMRFDRLCLTVDGEAVMIDHLVLLPSGVAVILDVPVKGELHARSNDALWARIRGGQREAFPNPLRQRERLLSLVADITGCQRLHLHFFIVLPSSCRLLTGSLDHVGSADAIATRLTALGPTVLAAKQLDDYAQRLRRGGETLTDQR